MVSDQNGLDSNLGEDSDSLGNSRTSKTSITPPAKEKRKPFFKKVTFFNIATLFHAILNINMYAPSVNF